MIHQDKNTTGFNPLFQIKKRQEKSLSDFVQGLHEGNRYILSECITLIESNLPAKRNIALKALNEVLKSTQPNSIRVGITGTPGVGKSTLIESFGLFLIDQGYKPAVLTIDPSSQKTQGSILGDKTRMPLLSINPKAYVRPSSSGNVLGGIATYTKDVIRLCEAAGFDFIIVETVGVGQSETEIKDITDVTVLLLQPGAGDEIQGIKRGIVETGDIFVITKSDGLQVELALQTQTFYSQALKLFHHEIPSWVTPVIKVSAIEGRDMDKVLDAILAFKTELNSLNLLEYRRKEQDIVWFQKQMRLTIQSIFASMDDYKTNYEEVLRQLKQGDLSTTQALDKMEYFVLSKLSKL